MPELLIWSMAVFFGVMGIGGLIYTGMACLVDWLTDWKDGE